MLPAFVSAWWIPLLGFPERFCRISRLDITLLENSLDEITVPSNSSTLYPTREQEV